SGNGNDVSQGVRSLSPLYRRGVLNGRGVLEFVQVNNRIRRTGFSDFPVDELNVYMVLRTSDSGDGILSYAVSGSDNEYLLFNSSNVNIYVNSSNVSSGVAVNDNSWHILGTSWRSSDGRIRLYLNGGCRYEGSGSSSSLSSGGCLALGGEQDAVDGGYSSTQDYDGYMGEVILYNQELNDAQRVIVENYLSSKYGISLDSNDVYSLDSLYGNDVAGIGDAGGISNKHLRAQSGGMLLVSSPSALDSGEYLLFGHNDSSLSEWDSVLSPSNSAMLKRVWRMDETGDVGLVSITVDTLLFPSRPNGSSDYVVLLDGDGDFSGGSEKYLLSYDVGSSYRVDGVDVWDSVYVGIGVLLPEVNFRLSSSNGSEGVSPAYIEVELSDALSGTVSVSYQVVGGSATGGGVDYSLSSGSVVFLPGSVLETVSVVIEEDVEIELDETIEIGLSGVVGARLGSDSVHVYTINDNDEVGSVGPGGVGDSSNLLLWLRGDDLSDSSDGSGVGLWPDTSGNGNDAVQLTAGYRPVYKDTVLNGHGVVRFGGTDDRYEDIFSLSSQSMTIFTVFSHDMLSGGTGSENGPVWQLDKVNGSGFFPYWTDGNQYLHYGGDWLSKGSEFNRGEWYIGMVRYGTDTTELWKDGVWNDGIGSNTVSLGDFQLGCRVSNGDYYKGDIAEVIYYNRYLNDAQRVLVENYLSSKYGIVIGGDDRYAFDTLYGEGVAGIGHAGGNSYHTSAWSGGGVLRLSNASDLDSSEYLLFGHNGDSLSSWSSVGAPSGVRLLLSRVWRLDETGDVGRVTVTLDTSLLPARPSKSTDYVLLLDRDLDFSIGAVESVFSLDSGSIYSVDNVEVWDSLYMRIGVLVPEARFKLSSGRGWESVSPVKVEVELSSGYSDTVRVVYGVSGGSATGGGVDYSLLGSDTLEFVPRDISETLYISIVNDDSLEIDETIRLTLLEVVGGVIGLGSDTVYEYTIRDNDNPGYVGPGGVGDSMMNVLWLRGDDLSDSSDGDTIGVWYDTSGNGNDVSQGVRSLSPLYRRGVLNGRGVLEFVQVNNRIRRT
ncbi:hypothetical protein DRJ17_07465, partial [Candidatus Woesearchaeota archaeon]